MKYKFNIVIIFLCLLVSIPFFCILTYAKEESVKTKEGVEVQGQSAIVMESTTGQTIYEKNADKELPPASVTKVMTLLLIFDAINDGKIALDQQVTVSEYAASMGGSQVFLEPGETQSVDTMIKCIVISSANDACVAMAEFIAGSEDEFVNKMNDKAKKLGMRHTTFKNCNGLDEDGHVTSARDIAIMSRELTIKHPEIFEYTKIWMEDITHKTKKEEKKFGLSNTNKLMRQYEYATGLKTGSTGKAKFCLSATATKNGIDLIAVVMAEPDSKTRVKDSIALLNYGFSKANKYEDDLTLFEKKIQIEGGEKDSVGGKVKSNFQYIDLDGKDLTQVKKKILISENIHAPIKKDSKIGSIRYFYEDQELGEVDIVACESVKKLSFLHAIKKTAILITV